MSATGITAGEDDEPREMRLPPAGMPHETPFDAAPLVAAWLRIRCAAEVAVAPAAGELPALSWWARSDGARCGVGGGTRIAAALLARDCGGAFDPGAATGASVDRAARDFGIGVRDALLPGGDWLPAPPGPAPAQLRISVAGIDDSLAVAVTLPPDPAVEYRRTAWRAALDKALGRIAVPVRLVLHEVRMPMREVRGLGVGDLLPIATAREVALRVGAHGIARARITAACDGSDTGSIEIVGGRA